MTELVKQHMGKWINENILGEIVRASGGEMDDSYKEYNDMIVEKLGKTRIMYEFYDSYNIKMGLMPIDDKFTHVIGLQYSEKFDTRKQAENEGFNKCAELLNEKLCPKQ